MAHFRSTMIAGERHGRLTAIELVDINRHREHLWRFRCDCGNETIITAKKARSGHTSSCGCFRREVTAQKGRNNATHGQTGSPEYTCWHAMLKRCKNPNNDDYDNYGGRGISVCPRWHSFERFIEDMGLRPSPRHSIDRYPDNNGNYEPSNCRWATPKEQAHNRRNNHLVMYNGELLPLSEASRRAGVNMSTAWRRIRVWGWSDDDALRPIDGRNGLGNVSLSD